MAMQIRSTSPAEITAKLDGQDRRAEEEKCQLIATDSRHMMIWITIVFEVAAYFGAHTRFNKGMLRGELHSHVQGDAIKTAEP